MKTPSKKQRIKESKARKAKRLNVLDRLLQHKEHLKKLPLKKQQEVKERYGLK